MYKKIHIDIPLLLGILCLEFIGIITLYSASNQNFYLCCHQLINFCISFIIMILFAQIHINRYQKVIPWIFGVVQLLLITVIYIGAINRGVQRWLNFGFIKFQPSEIMKLMMPMVMSWYLNNKNFPLRIKELLISCIIIIFPAVMIAKQPDLGTAIIIVVTGILVLLLSGISKKIISYGVSLLVIIIPIIWHFMHKYQKQRLFSFWSPEKDPLGNGYNIIQSKIAIGSGGILGKGWLCGSQAYLQFLPVRSTDFIFAVYSEEFGFLGCMLLFGIFIYITGRCLYIAVNAQNTFSRLLVGSLSLSFFASFFINVSMATGILPVVGIPLPLISYGGSSLLTFMASFGIIMSVHKHRNLIDR